MPTTNISLPGSVWQWLLSNMTVDHITVILSALALLVSLWSVLSSKRGVAAAERGASAAADQANAAAEQARAANEQLQSMWQQLALQKMTAEVDALVSAKHQINQAAPRLAVAIESISERPLVAEVTLHLPTPHPQGIVGAPERYVLWEDWHFDLYVVAKGTIFNPGPEPVRLAPLEIRFIEGRHPVTGEHVSLPQRVLAPEPAVMLYPGQLACFELLIQNQIWNWIDSVKADTFPVKITKTALAMPASSDEPFAHILFTFHTYSKMLKVIEPEGAAATVGDLKILVADECHFSCQIEQKIQYPDSIDWLHAEVTRDEDKLESLARDKWNNMAIRALLKRERERGETAQSSTD